MLGAFLVYLTALAPLQNHSYTGDEAYRELPRFWTSTGFCPAGAIQHKNVRDVLLSKEVQMSLQHIAALPNGALTHLRIHWLLELVKFIQYTPAGVPIYDFTDLDEFVMNLNDLGVYPVLEFMANPGRIFVDNPDIKDLLWQDLSCQVTKRYLNIFGAKKLLQWRFETWNEPDILNYNRLNFTVEEFLEYVWALRRGLTEAGRRPTGDLHFPLRGPAGLFKTEIKHPFCWSVLKACNSQVNHCPIDIITYHRKGQGSGIDVLETSSKLLQNIYAKYTNLVSMPVSNDEADPIAGWSTPHDYNEDVRYAAKLVCIVLLHWHAKWQGTEFKNLESISHDNAFLSYHPFEFAQRTLLAHFRMNNSVPQHSQFIQKPVYAALGMLSKLAPRAADIETIYSRNHTQGMWLLKTCAADNEPLYMSWLLVPHENTTNLMNFTFQRQLPHALCPQEIFAYMVEVLEQRHTDPAHIWRTHIAATPYPNAMQRAIMRRAQTPRVQATGILRIPELSTNVGELQLPWILLLRVCSNLMAMLKQPQQLTIIKVTQGEVFLSWREAVNTTQCLKTYEVWFQTNKTEEWQFVSDNWHLPFPSFQFAPIDGIVNGFYKTRGLDLFNRKSKFSEWVEYIEL